MMQWLRRSRWAMNQRYSSARHSAGQKIAVDRRGNIMAEEQIEREESPLVHEVRRRHGVGAAGVNVFGAFAVDENRIRPQIENAPHRQQRSLAAMLDVGDEARVAHQPLVPPAEGGGEKRRHINFIDRRIVSHPRIALGELAGILGEILRPLRDSENRPANRAGQNAADR